MHKVLVNHLGGLRLPRKSVVRLTDCPDMTLDDVKQQHNNTHYLYRLFAVYKTGVPIVKHISVKQCRFY